MRKHVSHIASGNIGAAVACIVCVVLWSAPVLLAGRLWNVLPHLFARNVAATGLFRTVDTLGRILSTDLLVEQGVPSAADGRLSMLYIGWLSQWIAWSDSVLWAVAGSATFAVGLWCFWKAVSCRFGKDVAWLTLIFTALLPVYWREAVWFDHYNLSFMFLFASMAAFCCYWEKRPWIAILLSGLCLGLSLSAKDVFLIFLPWIFLTVLWKREWLKGGVFFFLVFLMYLLPYWGDLHEYGYPINQNLARIWPHAEDIANETYLHLYPDPYTFFSQKEQFDREFLEAAEQKSFTERMVDEKVILSYGLEEGLLRRLRLGAWLLLNDIPSFFQRQNVGGAFMWLFILPGIISLFRHERTLAYWLLGLVISAYIAIRCVLLYEREHIMDIAWILSFLSALGVLQIAGWISRSATHARVSMVVLVCTLLVSVQLMQANRYAFARRYRESTTVQTLAAAEAMMSLPESSVIALGSDSSTADRLALLSNRTVILLREETVQKLRKEGTLEAVLRRYGVTHAVGYRETLPSVESVKISPLTQSAPSGFVKFLLSVFR